MKDILIRDKAYTDATVSHAELCIEEATRFTNVLHGVTCEGETSYTASSSTMAVAGSLLVAQNRWEFPARLHRVFNEFIGRPTSTFHLKHSDALSQVAFMEYAREGTAEILPIGASRSGLSILTDRFLKRTQFMPTVLCLVADGLEEFFDFVVRAELGCSRDASCSNERSSAGEGSRDKLDLRGLLKLEPRLDVNDVVAGAADSLSNQLGWALLQVARHYLYSSSPELRTMPQPIFPAEMSLAWSKDVVDAFGRLQLERPVCLGAVQRQLERLDKLPIRELLNNRQTLVLEGAALLEHAARLVPQHSLLNGDILAWRALAAGRFAAEADLPRNSALVESMRDELDERSRQLGTICDSRLSKHYSIRLALLKGQHQRVKKHAEQIRMDWPAEYPGHIHFFAEWKLWAEAARRKNAAEAKRRWRALGRKFPSFCENELPHHRWFFEQADWFADQCTDRDEFPVPIQPLLTKSRQFKQLLSSLQELTVSVKGTPMDMSTLERNMITVTARIAATEMPIRIDARDAHAASERRPAARW